MIRSIGKAFTVLELVGQKKEFGIADIVNQLKWKKSTVHRIASSLEELGYLEQNAVTLKYRLSLKFFSLGNLTKTRLNLHAAALPFLEKLQRDTGESVYLGVMDRHEVVYVEHLPSQHLLQPLVQVGSRAPLHCTAIGKTLLSDLTVDERRTIFGTSDLNKKPTSRTLSTIKAVEKALVEIRKTGFAIDNEEYHLGIRSIAAPIRDGAGRVIAGISVAGPTVRLDLQNLKKMGDLLKRTAESISRSLKGSGS